MGLGVECGPSLGKQARARNSVLQPLVHRRARSTLSVGPSFVPTVLPTVGSMKYHLKGYARRPLYSGCQERVLGAESGPKLGKEARARDGVLQPLVHCIVRPLLVLLHKLHEPVFLNKLHELHEPGAPASGTSPHTSRTCPHTVSRHST